ncbi:hypothetical protein CDAR_260421 [Caerostris darwini]|uniref:Uncharacterized protein n=1 Tax=Caerostris darwini TaxID=1538125 RepID=A0AAV4NSC8_9ARAC|nr:hypothetical protein CDAR_260421 [Caerostris darwini]
MATDVDKNLLSRWTSTDQIKLGFNLPEAARTPSVIVWIVLVAVIVVIFFIWVYCLMITLKRRAFRRACRRNLLSLLPNSVPLSNLDSGERYYPRHDYVQRSRSFNFSGFRCPDAPPKYSEAVHQESTAVGPSGRFNCLTIVEEGRLESPPPAYTSVAPFGQGVGFVNYI